MTEQIKTATTPISEKLENILKFGSIQRVGGADSQLQNIQLKTLRNIEEAMKVGQFGFNSKCPIGSRVVVTKIGNEKIIIANEHIASIIDITDGNTIIYNEKGTYIKLEDDTITTFSKDFIINSENTTINATASFKVNSPLSEFSEVVNSYGLLSAINYSGLSGSSMTTNVNLETSADVKAGGISLNGHTHSGVISGASNTGGPN